MYKEIKHFMKHFITLPLKLIEDLPSTDAVDDTEENVIGRCIFYSYKGCFYLITVTKDMIYVDSFPRRFQFRLNVDRDNHIYSVNNSGFIITSEMIVFAKMLTAIY